MSEQTRYWRCSACGLTIGIDKQPTYHCKCMMPGWWEPVVVLPAAVAARLRALEAAVNDDELAGNASAVKLYRESLRRVLARMEGK